MVVLGRRRNWRREERDAEKLGVLYIHTYLLVYTYKYICYMVVLGRRRGWRREERDAQELGVRVLLANRLSHKGRNRQGIRGVLLAYTRYSFTPKLSFTSQPSFYCPLHLHCSHYCNTIARLMRKIRPPPDPPCVCHTPYNIGSVNIV